MRPYRSIKFKVALAATLLFMTAMAAISVIQIHQLRTESVRILSEQQFTLVTRAAEEIEDKLQIRLAVLATEAANLAPNLVLNGPGLHAYFDNEIALHTLFDNFSVVSVQGHVVYTTAEIPGWRTVNVSDRPYFREVMANHAAIITQPFLSKLQNRPRVAVAAPIMDDKGDIAGILIGSLDLLKDNFLGEIGDTRIGKNGYFYLVTRGSPAIVIMHRDRSRIMGPALPTPNSNPSLVRALQGYEGTLEGTNSYGIYGLFSFKTLPNVNWVLAAVLPMDEAYEPINRTMKTTLLMVLLISIVVASGIWGLIYWLLAPLETLRTSMDSALSDPGASGPRAGEVVIERRDEIGRLTRKFNELMAARNHAEEQLAHAARHDGLTNLPNRMLFNDRLQQALGRGRRNAQPIAVMYVDADYFKNVNDTLGHAAGDELLVQFGQRATACVRTTDTVARLGGDEFAVILENVGRPDAATAIAEKIVNAMRKPFDLKAGETNTTASIGIAYLQKVGQRNIEAILKVADEALYAAKSAGRNGYNMSIIDGTE